jgi:hypothetical protein
VSTADVDGVAGPTGGALGGAAGWVPAEHADTTANMVTTSRLDRTMHFLPHK